MHPRQSSLPFDGRGFLAGADGPPRVVQVMTDFVKQDGADVKLPEERNPPVPWWSGVNDVIDDEKHDGGGPRRSPVIEAEAFLHRIPLPGHASRPPFWDQRRFGQDDRGQASHVPFGQRVEQIPYGLADPCRRLVVAVVL